MTGKQEQIARELWATIKSQLQINGYLMRIGDGIGDAEFDKKMISEILRHPRIKKREKQ